MTEQAFTKSTVESAALAWLQAVGWQVAHGAEIAPNAPRAERADYSEVILVHRLREALARLNPELPAEALADTFRRLKRPDLRDGQAGGADLIERHRVLYRPRSDGVMGFQIGLLCSVR